MSIHRPLSTRDAERLQSEHRSYRMSKMDRDHELELLLTAGVDLDEARAIVDGVNA